MHLYTQDIYVSPSRYKGQTVYRAAGLKAVRNNSACGNKSITYLVSGQLRALQVMPTWNDMLGYV
jgi:hypothetical protein